MIWLVRWYWPLLSFAVVILITTVCGGLSFAAVDPATLALSMAMVSFSAAFSTSKLPPEYETATLAYLLYAMMVFLLAIFGLLSFVKIAIGREVSSMLAEAKVNVAIGSATLVRESMPKASDIAWYAAMLSNARIIVLSLSGIVVIMTVIARWLFHAGERE